MMTKVRTLAVMGWLFSTTAAYAGSPGWTVSEASGSVAISRAGLSNAVFNRTAAKGGKVTEGDIIATGANGRAVIVRGEEYVIVAPNSRLRIVNTTETNTLTQFFQSAGNSVFKIKKKMTPHFGVQTPYLAAVVKGTTFSVTVTPTGAAVQVTEGRVQVSTLDGAATHLVIPGEIGMVSQGMPYRLTVQGAEPQIIDSPNRGQLLQKPQPSADTTDSKPAESDSAASVVADADTPKDAPASRFEGTVVAAVTEGPVNLDSVTGGMVSGNSTLVSTVASTVAVASIQSETPRPVLQANPPIVVNIDPAPAEVVAEPGVVPLPPTPSPDVVAPPVNNPISVAPPIVASNDPSVSPPSPAPALDPGEIILETTPPTPSPVQTTPPVNVALNDPSLSPPSPALVLSPGGSTMVSTPPTIDTVDLASNPAPVPVASGAPSGPSLPVAVIGNNQGPGNSLIGQNQSGSNQSGNNQSGNNQSGNNQSGNNQSGSNQSGNNQSGNNMQANNLLATSPVTITP
jgi:FecR protein